MSEIAVELELASEQYEQLVAIARAQQRSVPEMTRMAFTEWLERQNKMQHARHLMRELGQGLAQGTEGRAMAENHDT